MTMVCQQGQDQVWRQCGTLFGQKAAEEQAGNKIEQRSKVSG